MMLISFDLDDTLICYDPNVPREPNRVTHGWRWKYREPMRAGTVELLSRLVTSGHTLAVYTTSQRPVRGIRRWFDFYGIPLHLVVNQKSHPQKQVSTGHSPDYFPSKHPDLFGIDLHVDDAEGVAREDQRFGFRVLVVDPSDLDWHRKVLVAVERDNQV